MTSPALPYGVRHRQKLSARELPAELSPFQQQMLARAESAVAEPLVGVTTDGQPVSGLYSLRRTGVPTQPLVDAARDLLDVVTPFPLEDVNWRKWNNTHPFIMRHGTLVETLSEAQRDRALALLAATLSATGFQTARDIMRLNHTIGEITGQWDEYGEWLYWVSLFGTPSVDQPWGWQIDGHHLNLNCVVVGDQVVMTPMFMGSEPTVAPFGKYAGTRVFDAEERIALEFMHSLSDDQRRVAVISQTHAAPSGVPGVEGLMQSQALRDNLVLPSIGLRCDALSPGQRAALVALFSVYTGRMRDGHARLRLDEIVARLDDTYVAWYGGIEADSTFYYRLHSPVVLIEFDHLRGVALDNDGPARTHIHTMMRTPNGGDYGHDLLRQHYQQHDHSHAV